MEELSDQLYDSIMEDLDKGDDAVENLQLKAAITHYQNGLSKVPSPKTDWEISLHLFTALGDAYFNLEEFEFANENYNQALKCPDALDNGYIWLGLGQSYFELNNLEKAKDALMSAYMLEGDEIFEDVDPKYFNLIKPFVENNSVDLFEESTPYRTHEGKDYTQEEWEKYEAEQWKKFKDKE